MVQSSVFSRTCTIPLRCLLSLETRSVAGATLRRSGRTATTDTDCAGSATFVASPSAGCGAILTLLVFRLEHEGPFSSVGGGVRALSVAWPLATTVAPVFFERALFGGN